ncbi:hypothetical protein PVT67_12790 [Gallaecimonas kandeliae]|uniref:hypothetical protein n=1 Tax=Gallaecimonas kandeliae TaxID=3029055 RepID=UPI002647354D|nr:hypothetical protein [Gallaecimonas kandeliae]WKE64540.1 hypothetical protein PVT67_12790 [Gallaecimonas kandeliae]
MSSELNDVIQALKAEGHRPTLALVKARLKSPLPLPVIIKALQGEPLPEQTPPPEPFSAAQKAWLDDFVATKIQEALAHHGLLEDKG